MRNIICLILILLLNLPAQLQAKRRHATDTPPKREFRGAWIQCVNGQYLGKTPQEIRDMLSSQLDVMAAANINAIFFQVRAEADALYRSSYEPWSRYLTGQQGRAPQDGWDPLEWMVAQCHQRGMECHAWINPYRAKTKGTTAVAQNNVIVRKPERVFRYGDLFILNPALEENRMYTCMVVEDIISRYDVDGIHMDDYFYPYPEAGQTIPDEDDFQRDPRGFSNIADWRRDNVNLLIRDLHRLIRQVKPWVKFGISPFGIYRNSSNGQNCAQGSATNGLQNYDDLYADPVRWQNEGWVDYLIPQVYWNIGNRAADYETLCRWWNDYCHERPLFIGQDVERTVKEADPSNTVQNQTAPKYALLRMLPHVSGTCQWYAAAFVNNPGNYRTLLEQSHFRYHTLQPEMPFIDKKRPKPLRKLKVTSFSPSMLGLSWEPAKAKKEMDKAVSYAVYDFGPKEKVNLDDPSHIVAVTRSRGIHLSGHYYGHTIVVTALDHTQNESKGTKLRLKNMR